MSTYPPVIFSSKYFLKLEKRNNYYKVINKLKDGNNQVITEPELILKEQMDFSKSLHTSKVDISKVESTIYDTFLNIVGHTLIRDKLERRISE